MIIQYLATGIIAIVLVQMLIKVIRDRTQLTKLIFWGVLWGTVLVLIWFPSIMGWLGKITGVGRGVDVLIYFAIIFLFYYILKQNSKFDKLNKSITKITREIAKQNAKK